MNYFIRDAGGFKIISLKGDLGIEAMEQVLSLSSDLVRNTRKDYIFDLAEAGDIDRHIFYLLFDMTQKISALDGCLYFMNIRPELFKKLEVIQRWNDNVRLFTTGEEAMDVIMRETRSLKLPIRR